MLLENEVENEIRYGLDMYSYNFKKSVYDFLKGQDITILDPTRLIKFFKRHYINYSYKEIFCGFSFNFKGFDLDRYKKDKINSL
ncbi:Conserved hypothetical protein [Clostridium acetobutylicum EA 2018]|uniref:Uncharacterized protein n=1 Tax=Clostridium acetobutylicum (strain ATCC 824 / DSM 792 / JCM 1419 / IAM 19013 / LMG 5710 / NBRC 13948 / NRRL B-527 / VKM B-1787 / 2291 / W) TaxID=272562 RepID=Q97JX0_CLOAB|nr:MULTISPECIES: hypothetical protein [Clostridium]AAK79125.1 Hypothetical protein CA_C1153 [Clostridium acetobutylicum ATCC 824]ADZ20203.1 Conserved hypothetical protein [Clostridium acetobutylicum EA 2018]AEI31661.1 hypothetical protein SMB_G1173 [Clostridium acetobutylicum DSM 1731]AWV81622.1 hypothetical protein DK921_16290 [Clostridium acetobutylicum]MBC2393265.1 hypothetical protein [Clostridium acetobutylicum]